MCPPSLVVCVWEFNQSREHQCGQVEQYVLQSIGEATQDEAQTEKKRMQGKGRPTPREVPPRKTATIIIG